MARVHGLARLIATLFLLTPLLGNTPPTVFALAGTSPSAMPESGESETSPMAADTGDLAPTETPTDYAR